MKEFVMFSSRRSRISKFIGLSLAFLSSCSPNSYAGKVVLYVIPDYPYCCKKKIKWEEVETVCFMYKDSDLKRYEFDFDKKRFGREDLIKIGEKIGLNLKFVTVDDARYEKSKEIFDKVHIENVKKDTEVPLKYHAIRDRARIVKIELPDCIERVGSYAFTFLISLLDIKLPSELSEIENLAFYGCRNLDLKLSGKCKKIWNKAFYRCYHIREVDCKELNEVGNCAFHRCFNLEKFDFSKVKKVGRNAFDRTGLVNVELGKETLLSEEMFAGCEDLNSIKIDNNYNIDESGNMNIPSKCFWGCKSLNSVKLAEGIKCIEECAFAKCYSLNFVNLENCKESLKKIGKDAFYKCYSLVYLDARECLFSKSLFLDEAFLCVNDALTCYKEKTPFCINLLITFCDCDQFDRCDG